MVLRDRGDPGGRGGDPAVLGQSFRAAPSPGRQAPRRPADGRRRDAPGHPWPEEEGPSDDKLVQFLAWATACSARPTRPLHVSVHGPGRLDEGCLDEWKLEDYLPALKKITQAVYLDAQAGVAAYTAKRPAPMVISLPCSQSQRMQS